MQRHHEDIRTEGVCGEISCRYGRNGVNVTRIRMSKVKAIGQEGETLAELTGETPMIDSVLNGYEIKGSLSSGKLGGKIEIRLLSSSDCHHGVFACDVTYNDEMKLGLTDMSVMGPGLSEKITGGEHKPSDDSRDGDNCFRLEAEFSEKTSRLEKSLDYNIDRIERVLFKRNDHVTMKLTEVEQAMNTKLTGIESRFDGKYTRLDKINGDLSDQVRLVEKRLSQDLATCSSQYTDLQKQMDDLIRKEGNSHTTVSELKNEIQDVVGSVKISKVSTTS